MDLPEKKIFQCASELSRRIPKAFYYSLTKAFAKKFPIEFQKKFLKEFSENVKKISSNRRGNSERIAEMFIIFAKGISKKTLREKLFKGFTDEVPEEIFQAS